MKIAFFLFPLFVLISVGIPVLIVYILRRRELRRIGEAGGRPFSVLSIALAFDPDSAIIWDTQLPALRLISSAGPKGLSSRRLYLWYLQSAHRYPELYDGSSFRQWLAFFEQSQLITSEKGRVLLMSKGCELLHDWVSTQSDSAWQSEVSNDDTE